MLHVKKDFLQKTVLLHNSFPVKSLVRRGDKVYKVVSTL